jgi:hypothetical protein
MLEPGCGYILAAAMAKRIISFPRRKCGNIIRLLLTRYQGRGLDIDPKNT